MDAFKNDRAKHELTTKIVKFNFKKMYIYSVLCYIILELTKEVLVAPVFIFKKTVDCRRSRKKGLRYRDNNTMATFFSECCLLIDVVSSAK